MTNTDIAISALLLGSEATQRLYSLPQKYIEGQALALPGCGFLQRLRLLLKHCCTALGVEAMTSRLLLPRAIAQHLVGEFVRTDDDDMTESQSFEYGPQEQTADSSEEKREAEVILTFSEEQKKSMVIMYMKGIKLQYIAALYGIENPRVIHGWGDWKKRPKIEADKNIERRMQITRMLESGETVKSIRIVLKLKERVYRELMGIAIGSAFGWRTYESVMNQMSLNSSRKVVSRNSGVPMYFIKRWLQGKGVPDRPLIEDDAEGSAETKRRAITRFYEIGNALTAAKMTGVPTPQMIERWVVKFQKAVDDREKEIGISEI